jgi:asparagine synthase (glutamine-hydrolysing)
VCGIAGIRRFDGQPVDEGVLRAMTAQLAHRGPDDEGYWVDGPVGFGHRRLSIIDLAGSPQPMAGAGGATHVVFNGEIFNYRELRRRFPYPYRTNGDTEVLLAAYEAIGAEGVQGLVGQFAYAIHDGRSSEL